MHYYRRATTYLLITACVCLVQAQPWWNSLWKYRVAVEVQTGSYERFDRLVETPLNFGAMLAQAGTAAATFDSTSVRVVETDNAGTILGEVACQLDTDTLRWVLSNRTPASTTRHFWVYFDDMSSSPKPASSARPLVMRTNGYSGDGQQRWQFTTPGGYYVFEERGGAFEVFAPSPCADNQAGDWQRDNYSQWCGILNVGDDETKSIFHSNWKEDGEVDDGTWGGVRSTIVREGPVRCLIRCQNRFGTEPNAGHRANTTYEGYYEILPWSVRFTMTQANSYGYAVIMELTPGGDDMESSDYVVLPNGSKVRNHDGDLSPEWFFVGDTGSQEELFFIHHEDDAIRDKVEDLSWMHSFCVGFGRGSKITTVPQTFSFGFRRCPIHQDRVAWVNSLCRPLTVTVVGTVQRRPAALGCATRPARTGARHLTASRAHIVHSVPQAGASCSAGVTIGGRRIGQDAPPSGASAGH